MGYKNLLIGSQLTDLYLRLILVTKSSSLTNLYNRDLKNIATMYFTQKHKQWPLQLFIFDKLYLIPM